MALNEVNIRLRNKLDTYQHWYDNNPQLLSGEVIIVEVPAETGELTTEPAYIIKVGDGTSNFRDLPYLYALAADVSEWAKADEKPTYKASEIEGLADYVSGKINDTNTRYKLEQDPNDPTKIVFSSKEVNTETWTTEATITVAASYDDSALQGEIDALKGLVGTTKVSKQISDAITALKLADTYEAKGAAATVQGNLDKLVGTDTGKTVRQIAGEELAAQLIADNAADAMNSLEEIAAWIQSHPNDASAMNVAIKALESKVGNTSVSAQIGAAIKELQDGDIANAVERIKTLEGDSHTHSNASVLNSITQQKVNAWDAKVDDSDLATVAKTGNIADLSQTSGTYIVFNCGSSTVNM